MLVGSALAQNGRNWEARTAWVRDLDAEEQLAVLILLNIEFNDHYVTKIVPANQGSAEKGRWAVRMFGWSRFLLSGLSTKNAELQEFLKTDADKVRALSLNWDGQQWAEDGRRAREKFIAYEKSIGSNVFARVKRQYAADLRRTGTDLIVSSMAGASAKQ